MCKIAIWHNDGNRNRLIREQRSDSGATSVAPVNFDVEYTYDQGGNRLSKIENHTGLTTTYTYDVQIAGSADGHQHNNRLLFQETLDEYDVAVERRWYHYGPNGNIERLVREESGSSNKEIFWFYYNTTGRLWLSVWGFGNYDEETAEVSEPEFFTAMEYRYEGGRQRYLVRERDPNDDFKILGDGQWRDHMGSDIHRDYTVDPLTGDVTDGTSYLSGVGFDDGDADGPSYFSSDQIGTSRRLTDSTGCATTCSPLVTERRIYTSFGELVNHAGLTPSPSRYGYAGAYGYEEGRSADPMARLGWLHVGERYYAPELGRFVQRDPIGIRGGLNTYLYGANDPVTGIDPTGLSTIFANESVARFTLWITGGERSWLDNKATVDKVGTAALAVGAVCTAGVWTAAVVAIAGAEFAVASSPVVAATGQRFNENQQALIELAKRAQNVGAKLSEARILLDWAREYGLKALDHINTTHWIGGPHIHIGPVNHIPIL